MTSSAVPAVNRSCWTTRRATPSSSSSRPRANSVELMSSVEVATHSGAAQRVQRGSAAEVLLVAFKLGLTSFGGPVAHLGYFRDEYVQRRRWLDEATYADL